MTEHDPTETNPTRRSRRPRRQGIGWQAWSLLAAMMLVLAVGSFVIVSSMRGGESTAVEPGTYVPPSEISTSPTSSSTSTKPKKKSTSTSSSTSPTSSITTARKHTQAPAPAGEPTRVQVTSGGRSIVDASLQATKLDSDNVLAPPFGTAGWYAEPGWPKPGHQGASILVGHINHGSQPDVFWNLPQVKIGDMVTVTYGSGRQVSFRITKSEPATKAAVPQDDSIWDHDNPDPVVRLITCDPTTPLKGGHFEGNWVVWAELA